MKFPAVNFILKDPQKEAQYICFLAKDICSGNYERGHFFVLPKPENNPHVVYFPNLKYSPRFWQVISACKQRHFHQSFPPPAVNEVIQKISHQETLKDLNRKNSIITWWKQHETEFFQIFSEFLDIGHTLDKINKIDVLLCNYGTRGSFYPYPSGQQIYIAHRTDLPAEYFIKTLLLSLMTYKTRIYNEIGHLAWKYQQALVDLLLSETIFNRLLNHTPKPIYSAVKNSRILETQSRLYLKSLGFSPKNVLELDSAQNILINNIPVDHLFTPQEANLMQVFIANTGLTLTFDRIAKALWPDNPLEKFSLYSITKIIENLRKKLRSQGINKEVILAVRGQGYFLRS